MKRMEQREQTASEERKGILSLPPEERPYEKCLEQGCQALSDAELLAVIIRTGAVGDTSVDLARRVLDLGGRQGESGRPLRAVRAGADFCEGHRQGESHTDSVYCGAFQAHGQEPGAGTAYAFMIPPASRISIWKICGTRSGSSAE